MISLEGSDPYRLIPQNIDNLLTTGLSSFQEHHGMSTRLCNVEGYPDLLVRIYDKDEHFLEETVQGLEAGYEAGNYGIDVLPSRLFFINGLHYVVTTKVQGQSLHELLSVPTDNIA